MIGWLHDVGAELHLLTIVQDVFGVLACHVSVVTDSEVRTRNLHLLSVGAHLENANSRGGIVGSGRNDGLSFLCLRIERSLRPTNAHAQRLNRRGHVSSRDGITPCLAKLDSRINEAALVRGQVARESPGFLFLVPLA